MINVHLSSWHVDGQRKQVGGHGKKVVGGGKRGDKRGAFTKVVGIFVRTSGTMLAMTSTIQAMRPRYFPALVMGLSLGCWSCARASQPAHPPVVEVPAVASATPEEKQLVSFEAAAKTGVPADVSDFVVRFFEAMHKDWRSGIQFMDAENYQEVRAQNPRMDPVSNDASILVFAISLIRFQGGEDPPDTDTDIDRIKAISSVHVTSFEQNEQIYRFGGKINLKDGRSYGLQLVIARDKLGVLGPL